MRRGRRVRETAAHQVRKNILGRKAALTAAAAIVPAKMKFTFAARAAAGPPPAENQTD